MSECKICGTRKGDMICQDCVDDNSVGHFEEARLRAEVERLKTRHRINQPRPGSLSYANCAAAEYGNVFSANRNLRDRLRELTAALATETRAVEMLAGEMHKCRQACPLEIEWDDCPAIDEWDKCTNNSAACWAAWARQKEVGK